MRTRLLLTALLGSVLALLIGSTTPLSASGVATESPSIASRSGADIDELRERRKRVCGTARKRARTIERRLDRGRTVTRQQRQRARTAARRCARVKERLAAAKKAAAPVQRDGFLEYVSLGDSWSADVVLFDLNGPPATEHAPIDCAQSHVNYPKLVAAELGIPVHRDATCGSATTDDFTGPQALPLGGTNAPQFDRLSPTTDLVTIGIGGNDAGIASGAMKCIDATLGVYPADVLPLPPLPFSIPMLGSDLPVGGCKDHFTAGGRDLLAEQIAAAKPKVVAAITRTRALAPNARILVLDYIAAIPEQGWCPLFAPVSEEDLRYLYESFGKLNAMVKAAAQEGGAEFVDTYTPTVGHDICQMPHVRYVEGLGIVSLNDVAVAVPAHPNSAGARAQADIVLEHIRHH
ncbi:SGNH/GDSL hydrolase family protein [Nocardioides limicola]|uniref:SGNH/GDSL hydrolase family protein n=1 Tax=Nocardioides limicola TaxID=2803368 RepID=UPI00193AE4A6|nr:SGNH/GDSL hydrolase family protein [Nocardioides sp. DJM-14]